MPLPPPPSLDPAPPPSRGAVGLLWALTLLGLGGGAARVRWLRPPAPEHRAAGEPRTLALTLTERFEPPVPSLPGPVGGSNRAGTGSRDPEAPAAALGQGLPPMPLGPPEDRDLALPMDLPLGPAEASLPVRPGGNGLPRGTGSGIGRGEGSGLGPGRGGGGSASRPPTPTVVDLAALTLRTSAAALHTVKSGETFADTLVVVRLTFGADGLPTAWDPLYGDPRLIPDALRAARATTFKVSPRLQAQAPLQVRMQYRFRHLGSTTQSPLLPTGVHAQLFEASAFECLQAATPAYQPRPGEHFLDPRVVLRVYLRENGVPFEAEAVSGDPRLRPSARQAALAHRYRVPPELKRHAPLALLLSFTFADLPG